MEYSPQDHPKSLAIMDATAADANGTPTNKMLPRKKVQHILNIKDRLPSIMGWLSESNTFDILAKACLENSKRHGMKIGIIRGPDHSLTDGALVLDPPKGFPFDDPEQASKWLQNPQNNITTLRLLRFDAKLGFSKLKAWQWAPFFIVTIPEFPDYICVVPIRSYANLFNVHRRSYRYDESTRMKTLVHSRKEIVYCDFLAPFAIHEDHVYRALISLANASTNKTPYVNPTTGVEFHGWFIPDPEKNLQGVLKVRSESQETSRVAIEELNSFLNDCPGMYMTLNPVGPLICDLILVDEQQSKYYHIEHKSHTPGAGGSEHLIKRLNPAWYDEKMNWHFLLNQSGNQLAIFTRKGDTDIESNKTPLQLIDMTKPGSATVFANTIRSYGPAARTRLHKKWKKVELYDDEIEDDGKVSGRYKTTEPAVPKLDAFGKPASESQQLGLAFQVNFNDLCYQQRRHGCILLSNHPSASAAIIEHVWDANDVFLYETSGLVPVSLVTSHMTTNRCILLRFVPHRLPTAQSRPNMSQLFELALAGTIDIPLCVAQEFFYVAMTGGIPVPGQQLSLDKVALLSSSQTNILGDSKVCSNCEGHTRPRIWKSLQNRISADETTARAREWFSFTQYPVLRTGAEPLKQLYSFEDGTVHQYFSHVFLRNDTDHVMPIHGPKGILQRQWNHGDLRENAFFGEHPSDELLHRVVSSLSLQHDPKQLSVAQFTEDLEHKTKEFAKSKAISMGNAKYYALEHLINETEYGLSLEDLAKLSGFSTSSIFSCDTCIDGKACRFLHPSITYALPDEKMYRCGCCWKLSSSTHPRKCTIRNMSPELIQQLRAFAPFRAHVPCHQCWHHGRLCDNNSDICGDCKRAGLVCERESCIAFWEPRDDSFCLRGCDKAHYDDGYMNTVTHARDEDGYNAQQAARSAVRTVDSRVAVCGECYAHGKDTMCTNHDICEPCARRIRDGETVACRRIKCKDFVACSLKNCSFAHASQAIPTDSLDAHVKKRAPRLQGKETISAYMPMPDTLETVVQHQRNETRAKRTTTMRSGVRIGAQIPDEDVTMDLGE